METKRTMTMNWEGLVPHLDDDDDFFDSNNRISAVVPMDLAAGGGAWSDSDDEFEDPRMSFASDAPRMSSAVAPGTEEYGIWMAAPLSIQERRQRLLKEMGLNSSKELMRLRTMAMSKKHHHQGGEQPKKSGASSSPGPAPLPPSQGKAGGGGERKDKEKDALTTTSGGDHDDDDDDVKDDSHASSLVCSPDTSMILVRSRSDGDIDPCSIETKRRKEQLIGKVSKQRLTRTSSTLAPFTRICKLISSPNTHEGTTSKNNKDNSSNNVNDNNNDNNNNNGGNNTNKGGKKGRGRGSKQSGGTLSASASNGQFGAFFLIKNLDTGNEFIVKEFAEDGMWNRLSDLQTGKQLTMEEFEKSVGYSPVVKELMRRENVRRAAAAGRGGGGGGGDGSGGLERKTSVNAYFSKSFRNSKRRGVSLLKNINRVANSVTGLGSSEKDQPPPPLDQPPPQPQQKGGKSSGGSSGSGGGGCSNNPEWVRVRSQGKAYKELTALRFCQEIQAHEGSIWTIKFNSDGRYLASAGEDKVIHVWEVQECEIASLRPPEEAASGNSTPLHPSFCPSPDRGSDRPPLAPPDLSALDKKKKGKSASRRGGANVMPDYVQLPETVFALSNDPVCSFEGHLDDVLDLSWSTSQPLLLSSSMDKTVRLWDLETKACLKLFAHNDYVTCIQFNPVNDDYFISGSLDAKVRIWSVPGRRVVDWTDLHEMVTAACYTPDGQGAAVGSHKGNCRMYSITDGKLNQTSQFDILNKKKSAPKKITGFEFTQDSSSKVLVTSADSRIRIYDGLDVIQKFRGFRNISSQIAASFSPDGKYVICASEDSNVHVWKREEPRHGKTKTMIDTRSHEYFQCKDVSVAIPWPGSIKFEPPTIQLHSKRNSKRVTAPQPPPASASGSPKKDEANKTNKKQLPPLPNNKKSSNAQALEKTDNTTTITTNNNDNDNDDNNVDCDSSKAPNSPESDPARLTRSESVGDSFGSGAGGSIRYGDSPSISSNHAPSPSWSPGWSWFDGGGSHGSTMQATAWGLVVVTAGLGGEIRAYQNFGLPLRVGRQTNLFRDLT